MGDAEVKDQAPAPGLIPQVVPNLHIAAPLACDCTPCCVRTTCPAVRINGPSTLTMVAVKVHAELFAAALSKRAIMESWEGGKDGAPGSPVALRIVDDFALQT